MKKIYIFVIHFGYWTLLILLMALLYLATQINVASGPTVGYFSLLVLSFVFCPSLVSFYGSYFLLFDLFVKKVSRVRLAIITFSLLAISTFFALMSVYTVSSSSLIPFEVGLVSFLLSSFNVLVGFILHSFISWFTDIKEKEELSAKTKTLELEMVKLKLDPHFLFNTINNIDVLIETNPTKASEYIIKLSSILRFYLYKTPNSKIQLRDEIMYIQEYVDLQKIRTKNENFVSFTVTGNCEGKEITPMVFIPFIENAFKHSNNKKTDSIDIFIAIAEKKVHFKCTNKLYTIEKEREGIGNDLIKKRLKLIYGNNYDLKIDNSNGCYIVELKIPV